MKVVAIIGNVSEVVIASSIVAELIGKIRGNKSVTPKPRTKETPMPDQPIAA